MKHHIPPRHPQPLTPPSKGVLYYVHVHTVGAIF